MSQISKCRLGWLTVFIVVMSGCQPIVLRSTLNDPDEECKIEYPDQINQVPAVGRVSPYSATSWLQQREMVCGSGKQKLLPATANKRLSERQKMVDKRLSELLLASCSMETDPAKMGIALTKVRAISGWSTDFIALFAFLEQQQQLTQDLLERQDTIRQEMQRKIDALTDIEADISQRQKNGQ
ncbi:MAG: hypothetical protein MI864_01890 [Pseudomonadales bacterium]|nr:hypothetical protein [Pseudomonadales bacterium]